MQVSTKLSLLTYQINDMCYFRLVSPLLMGYLIAYFMDNPYNHTEQDAYLLATGLALSLIITVLVFHPAQLYYVECSVKMRVACCSLIYAKVIYVVLFHRKFLK